MKRTQEKIIVLQKASPFISVLEDVFSFGGFITVMWFNHAFLSGNGWIDVLFIWLWISVMMSTQSRRYREFRTPEQAIKYLEEMK